ncbi:MAG: hypothetical protein KIT63_04245 [Rhodoferax sp.]|nr:hypothetical protein [Rhodoferax sp.]
MQTSIHHHPSIHVPVRVLGGTGTTGRRVAGRRAARGVPTCIASRTGRQGSDRNDCATWPAAFARRVGASGARRLAA